MPKKLSFKKFNFKKLNFKKFNLKKLDKKLIRRIALITVGGLLVLGVAVYSTRFFTTKLRHDKARQAAYRFGFKASFEVSMLRSCIEASRGQADYCNCYTERFVAMMDDSDWDRFMRVESPQATLDLIENDPSISGKIRIAMNECVSRVRIPKKERSARRDAGRAVREAAE